MRIRSQSKLRYAWAFTIFWNLVSAPATFLGAVPEFDNLFVAGAAVFPTGGVANPTFTALALSLRLADHLKSSRVTRT